MGERGGMQFPHLQFLVQSIPPPHVSKRCRGTLKGTLGYADNCIQCRPILSGKLLQLVVLTVLLMIYTTQNTVRSEIST